ncbi:hypothetical protein HELRODRAFT_171551 [Helobdella robusta]|uniref:Integrin alpha second immunoglobulin-like domain-containing protein n=1 Tax=Helobdella robusta TaxID=6412 RepID=T1F4E5_HELRO|nr:hypothetical protein HELRODRAFT_171551 [Helobdella robusta]ESO05206.1 hypothetical protein HELRODRAFT_171551 [Helobdella robusta]
MNIQVGNKLEDAFSTKLYIILPEQLRYIGSDDKECRRTGTLTVTCDVENPFPHGKYASVALRLDASLVDSSVRELYVHLIVNSSSVEVNYDDNEDIFVIKVNLSSDVVILANVQPESMYRNRQDRYAETLKHSKNTDDDSVVQKASMESSEIKIGKKVSPVFGSTLGDSFEHTFEVKNRGYTKTASLKLHIQVPLICGGQHRDRSDRGGDYKSSCRYFIDSTTIEFVSDDVDVDCYENDVNSGGCHQQIITLLCKLISVKLTYQSSITKTHAVWHRKVVLLNYKEDVGIAGNFSFHANMGANDDDVDRSKESILSKILKFGSGNDSSEQNVLYLTCDDESMMECISIECSVHPLTRGESAVVSSSPQVDEIKVTSRARVSIPSSQKTSEDIHAFDSSNFTLTTLTIFLRDNSGIHMHVPIWALVLSISLGVLALLHVVLIMYKCGFFKRPKRNILAPVHQATVKKPLNIRQMSQPTRFLPPRPFSR